MLQKLNEVGIRAVFRGAIQADGRECKFRDGVDWA